MSAAVDLGPHLTISKRGTILLTFAAFGSVVGTHVGALPFLVEASGVTPAIFGLAGALGMIANILFMGLGGIINRHADHRTVLLAAFPVLLAALCFALLVGNVWSFCLSFFILSACLGTIDLFMNAEASIVEQESGRRSFSTFHGMASLFIAGFAVVGSVVSVVMAPWFGSLFAGLVLALAWLAIYKNIPHRPVKNEDGSRRRRANLPRRALTFIGIAAGFNVACEVAAIQWAGQLLTSIAPELAAISGLGVAFYGLCGGSMRLLGDRLRDRFGDLQVMTVCLLVAVTSFLVLGFAPGFWISAMAFAGVGFGLSITFPCLFSLSARIVPGARAAAMGYVAAVGGAPRIILPWVLGFLAAQYSLGAVFAACAGVAAAALAIIVLSFANAEAHAPAPN